MQKPELDDLLKGLDVMRDALEGNPEDALRELEGMNDALSIRRRLILLLRPDVGDLERASKVIAGHAPDAEWAEFAVELHTRRLDRAAVENTLTAIKSRPDPSGTILKRSISMYGEWVLRLHSESTMATGHYRSFYAFEPPHRELADSFLAEAQPVIVNAILADNELANNLDKALARTYLLASGARGHGEHVTELMALLADANDVSQEIGLLVMDGSLPVVPLLPRALRESKQDRHFAELLAAAIEVRSGAPVEPVIEAALATMSKSSDPIKRHQAAMIAFDIALNDGIPAVEDYVRRTQLLKPIDTYIVSILLARLRLAQSNATDALALVLQIPEETMHRDLLLSECYRALEEKEKSLEYLKHYALSFCAGPVLAEAASRAFKLERFPDAIECLRKLIYYYPETNGARNNLLTAYYNADLWDDGINEAEDILAADSANIQARIQLGQLYLQVGKPEAAVNTLKPLFSNMDMRGDAVCIFLDALDAAHLSAEQFEVAERFKNKYWDRSDFLFRYFRAANKAQDDEKGHEALMELNKLREQGIVTKDQMRLGTLEEIKEMMLGFKRIREESSKLLLQGKMPWTAVAFMENRPIIMDWYIRTQALPWVVEEELTRAQFAIYGTNGFTVVRDSAAAPHVEPIGMTDDALTVAADYSTLVTLNELGLLATLDSVFQSVILPNTYRKQVVEDLRRLQPIQASKPVALTKLRKLLDENKFDRVKDYDVDKYPIVDEYDPDKPIPHVRLQDIRELLRSNGYLTDVMSAEFDKVIHDPRQGDATTSIKRGDKAVVRLLTLQTLDTIGALEPLLRTIRVCIIDSDYDTLIQDLREHAAVKIVSDKFGSLRNHLETLKCVKYAEVIPDEASEDGATGLPLDSYRLARQRQIPLMADDRVIQAARLNETGRATDAFGIQQYLGRLRTKAMITPEKHGELLTRLMDWRYRFIIVPPEALVGLAKTYKASLPGDGLASVARYIHDCMRDPGLFGGLETGTKPPISMALKLYLEWSHAISRFLYLLWIDPEFTDADVDTTTRWVATHMLPSSPASIAPQAMARLAEMERTAIITMVVMNTGAREVDDDRVSKGLRILGEALGLSEEQVGEAILEVVMYAAER